MYTEEARPLAGGRRYRGRFPATMITPGNSREAELIPCRLSMNDYALSGIFSPIVLGWEYR